MIFLKSQSRRACGSSCVCLWHMVVPVTSAAPRSFSDSHLLPIFISKWWLVACSVSFKILTPRDLLVTTEHHLLYFSHMLPAVPLLDYPVNGDQDTWVTSQPVCTGLMVSQDKEFSLWSPREAWTNSIIIHKVFSSQILVSLAFFAVSACVCDEIYEVYGEILVVGWLKRNSWAGDGGTCL